MALLGVDLLWSAALFGLLGFIDLQGQRQVKEQIVNNPYRLCLGLLKQTNKKHRRIQEGQRNAAPGCLVHV